ncbi:hypothetical protein BN996_03404 [Haloferax massiliensis]|uniref:Uncharacterized protein n=2 Tax=Haloferacaceae TaxID=1644056 RepID=A0A0D6JWG7_9EURY|nr:hypothetical protein BN996_03404 [Haloferax massiliensis]
MSTRAIHSHASWKRDKVDRDADRFARGGPVMLTGEFAVVSAVFVGAAVVTSGLGHVNRVGPSYVRARQLVFLFMLFGTITLAL